MTDFARADVRLGGMCRPARSLPVVEPDEMIGSDGRPTPSYRETLRTIPTWRNALTVVLLYLQTLTILWACVRWPSPVTWIPGFVLIGRAHAQFASLMHEAAHRLLFADKRVNDFVGKWLLGYTQLTSTAAYRRVHMAHHRTEFGPDEPDIPLYANYPIERASLRRKLVRDATGRTGLRLLRQQLDGLRSSDVRIRRTLLQMLGVQLVLFSTAVLVGHPYLYPVFWVLPYLTVWRVINRLRSIAEHGGLRADDDRRLTTHSVRQGMLARFFLVPYNIGFHLAHHVDPGVPFRALPAYHRRLHRVGYVDDAVEYRSYSSLWRALTTGGRS